MILMKQNPHMEEARKEKESKLFLLSSSFPPSNVDKQLELDKCLEKLNHVIFDTEARKRDDHCDQKSPHHRNAGCHVRN